MTSRSLSARALGAVAAVVLAAALIPPASAGGPGNWTQLGKSTANFAMPGLYRAGDGSLVAVWVRPVMLPETTLTAPNSPSERASDRTTP